VFQEEMQEFQGTEEQVECRKGERTSVKEDKRPGVPGGKRQQRLQTFVEVFVEGVLREGLDALTIEEITTGAGVAKGSFYRYFRNKEELLEQAFVPIRTAMSSSFDSCTQRLQKAACPDEMKAAYEELAGELGALFLENMGLVAVYLQESRGPEGTVRRPLKELSQQIRSHAIEMTKVAHQRGWWRPLSPEVSALSVIGAVETLLVTVLQGELQTQPFQAMDDLVALVLQGLEQR
jgi:AcrR family transcriptional regulator